MSKSGIETSLASQNVLKGSNFLGAQKLEPLSLRQGVGIFALCGRIHPPTGRIDRLCEGTQGSRGPHSIESPKTASRLIFAIKIPPECWTRQTT